jgi:hypothetical protein
LLRGCIPERGRRFLDEFLFLDDLPRLERLVPDAMTLGREMVEHRLHVVYCGGEECVWRFSLVEFLPERDASRALVGGKESEYAAGRGVFAIFFVHVAGRVVEKRVSRVYLDDIVNEQHFDDGADIDRWVDRFVGEDYRHEREMPGMLGGIFMPAFVDYHVLSVYCLEFFNLDDEVHLPFEPFGNHLSYLPFGSYRQVAPS